MKTECNASKFEFQSLGRREVSAAFDGGPICSDGGGLLLREVELRTGIIRQFSDCFTDHRDPELIEHTVFEPVAQRAYLRVGVALRNSRFPTFTVWNALCILFDRILDPELAVA